MTAKEFEQARERLDLSRAAFGHAFGVTERTVYRWERGRHPIPKSIAALVRLALESAAARRELGIDPSTSAREEMS